MISRRYPNGVMISATVLLLLSISSLLINIAIYSDAAPTIITPYPSTIYNTTLTGEINCIETATQCDDNNDTIQFSLTSPSTDLPSLLHPSNFSLSFFFNEQLDDNVVSITGNFNTFLESDIIPLTFPTKPVQTDIIRYVLVISYHDVDQSLVDNDTIGIPSSVETRIIVTYIQQATHNYISDDVLSFKHNISTTVRATLLPNFSNHYHTLNAVFTNTNVPIDKIYLRTFGALTIIDNENEPSSSTCLINGIVMDLAATNQEYLLSIPQSVSNAVHPLEHFKSHTELHVHCTLHFQYHNCSVMSGVKCIPPSIAIGFFPVIVSKMSASDIIYTKNNIPTTIFTTLSDNLSIINSLDQIASFKRISIPILSNDKSYAYTQYPRQFLVPKHKYMMINSPDEPETGSFTSSLSYRYHINGPVTQWGKLKSEFLQFTLSQLPSRTRVKFVKYAIFALSQVQHDETIAFGDRQNNNEVEYIVIGRDTIDPTSIKHHIIDKMDHDGEYNQTMIRVGSFVPHIFTSSDYRMKPKCFGPCDQGFLELFVEIDHNNLELLELKNYAPAFPTKEKKCVGAHCNRPIEPLAVLTYLQKVNTITEPTGEETVESTYANEYESSYSLMQSIDSFTVEPTYFADKVNVSDVMITQLGEFVPVDPDQSQLEIFITDHRLYSFSIKLDGVAHLSHFSHFILRLPTSEYSFFGNFTTCHINDELVIPTPLFYHSTSENILEYLQHHDEIGYNATYTVTESPMLLFPYSLSDFYNYTISCQGSGFLRPTISYGILEFLYNDHIPMIVTTTLPSTTETTNNAEIVIYMSSAIIHFTDHLAPTFLTAMFGGAIFFIALIIIFATSYICTLKWCSTGDKQSQEYGDYYDINQLNLNRAEKSEVDIDPTVAPRKKKKMRNIN